MESPSHRWESTDQEASEIEEGGTDRKDSKERSLEQCRTYNAASRSTEAGCDRWRAVGGEQTRSSDRYEQGQREDVEKSANPSTRNRQWARHEYHTGAVSDRGNADD